MTLLQGRHLPALGAWPWISVGGFNRNPLLFSSTSTRQKIKERLPGVGCDVGREQGQERTAVWAAVAMGLENKGNGSKLKQIQMSSPITKAIRQPR